MRFAFTIAAVALAYTAWRWTPPILDLLGLGEFLYIGRLGLILAALTGAESIGRTVL